MQRKDSSKSWIRSITPIHAPSGRSGRNTVSASVIGGYIKAGETDGLELYQVLPTTALMCARWKASDHSSAYVLGASIFAFLPEERSYVHAFANRTATIIRVIKVLQSTPALQFIAGGVGALEYFKS